MLFANGNSVAPAAEKRDLSPSTATLLMSGPWNAAEDGVALIGKPFTRQELLATVRGLLERCDFAKIEREQPIARSQRLAAIPSRPALQPTDTVVTE